MMAAGCWCSEIYQKDPSSTISQKPPAIASGRSRTDFNDRDADQRLLIAIHALFQWKMPRNRGSRRSLKESPTKLNANTSKKIATPGTTESIGCCSNNGNAA
jgi:hypothetical protein